MKIGLRLKELRESQKLSQTELSGKIGKSARMISFYEKDLNTPDTDTVVKYSEFFHISADWILGIKKVAIPELSETATAEVMEGFTGLSKEDAEILRQMIEEHKKQS